MLSQYLLIHSEAIKAKIKEIKAKTPKQLFMTPVWPIREGRGVKLTGYLDSRKSQGKSVSSYLLMNINDLGAMAVSSRV